jgi:hypothetical protein
MNVFSKLEMIYKLKKLQQSIFDSIVFEENGDMEVAKHLLVHDECWNQETQKLPEKEDADDRSVGIPEPERYRFSDIASPVSCLSDEANYDSEPKTEYVRDEDLPESYWGDFLKKIKYNLGEEVDCRTL